MDNREQPKTMNECIGLVFKRYSEFSKNFVVKIKEQHDKYDKYLFKSADEQRFLNEAIKKDSERIKKMFLDNQIGKLRANKQI